MGNSFIVPYAGLVRIARDNHKLALETRKPIAKLQEQYSVLTGDEANYFYWESSPVKNKADSHDTIAIVFSALAIEGYIYYYAIEHLPERLR